ncbi:MAG: hypothetical protein CVV64_08120 [Candidatus Wallbacteria bacterium HGW-Wallbacteria-1]|jgi:adenylate cyclase|uniref:Guanylate cyclase domain-containing protein n=1 Tax=Candidatus Wallbacteria bacterium HGW-Wallbacteria-1 TaxID=2013854 RepID=A0A2N1PR75_9BACT|nr:MAG: hypothetical protein CVV64_08120 [Candidatus Wallbacteria bacterium HGW-Wallbacteria-1]
MKVLSRVLMVTIISLMLWGLFHIMGWKEQMRNFSISLNHSTAFDIFSKNTLLARDIAIIPLDEQFYAWYGREPLKRSDMAILIRKAIEGGARKVYLDIFLEKPSSYNDDRTLLELLDLYRDRILFPSVILNSGKALSLDRVSAEMTLPSAIFGKVATGYVNLPVSIRNPFVTGFSVMTLPKASAPLPLAMAMLDSETLKMETSIDGTATFSWPANDMRVSTRAGQIIPMAFHIPASSTLPLRKVLCPIRPEALLEKPDSAAEDTEIPDSGIQNDVFRNKFVFIGDTTWKGKDWFRTPVGLMSGVELLATSLNTLLANAPIKVISPSMEIALLVISSLIIGGLSFCGHSRTVIVAIVMLMLTLPLAGGYLLAEHKTIFPGHSLLFGALVTWILATAWLNIRWSQMGIYISSRLRDKILMEDLEKGLTRKHIAILFSDIRGFTNLSEHLPTDLVINLLEEYFDIMAEIITSTKNEGTLDKFMGDGILAFFGDPIALDNPSESALQTASQMVSAFEKMRKKLQMDSKFQPHLEKLSKIGIGIGIATGDVYVGNIGARKVGFMDYTCIGREVNLASRLESMAGAGQILLCPLSAELCNSECTLHTRTSIKGFDNQVDVFTLKNGGIEK